jgi:multicomponent Na+:H+ antiporter subunit D
MHIAMHAFGKITLFFCAGAILVTTHKTEISQMRGLGRSMPITMAAFFICSLSIIGLPPMGGMWSKWFLALATLDAGKLALLAVLMVSTLLNVAYLLPIPIRAFFSTDKVATARGAIKEAPLPCLLALIISALGCMLLFFYPDPVYRLITPVVTR